MRWKAKPWETGWRLAFAWLPTRIGDVTLWLEYYWTRRAIEPLYGRVIYAKMADADMRDDGQIIDVRESSF